MKKLLVTLTSANEKEKIFQQDFTCENMVDVSRLLLTYQGKRGYEVVNIMIDVVEVLM